MNRSRFILLMQLVVCGCLLLACNANEPTVSPVEDVEPTATVVEVRDEIDMVSAESIAQNHVDHWITSNQVANITHIDTIAVEPNFTGWEARFEITSLIEDGDQPTLIKVTTLYVILTPDGELNALDARESFVAEDKPLIDLQLADN